MPVFDQKPEFPEPDEKLLTELVGKLKKAEAYVLGKNMSSVSNALRLPHPKSSFLWRCWGFPDLKCSLGGVLFSTKVLRQL